MSLGRSAIPIPVLRWSSAGAAPPSGEALYLLVRYEKTRMLADAQPSRLNAQYADRYLDPAYEDDMLLADTQPTHYLEPE